MGRLDSDKPAAIRLSGENILEEHCYIDNENGIVTLQAPADSITVGFILLPFYLSAQKNPLVFEREASRSQCSAQVAIWIPNYLGYADNLSRGKCILFILH